MFIEAKKVTEVLSTWQVLVPTVAGFLGVVISAVRVVLVEIKKLRRKVEQVDTPQGLRDIGFVATETQITVNTLHEKLTKHIEQMEKEHNSNLNKFEALSKNQEGISDELSLIRKENLATRGDVGHVRGEIGNVREDILSLRNLLMGRTHENKPPRQALKK